MPELTQEEVDSLKLTAEVTNLIQEQERLLDAFLGTQPAPPSMDEDHSEYLGSLRETLERENAILASTVDDEDCREAVLRILVERSRRHDEATGRLMGRLDHVERFLHEFSRMVSAEVAGPPEPARTPIVTPHPRPRRRKKRR